MHFSGKLLRGCSSFSQRCNNPCRTNPKIIRDVTSKHGLCVKKTKGLKASIRPSGTFQPLDALPSREWIHIPPNGKLGKSSTSKCHFWGICDRSLEGINRTNHTQLVFITTGSMWKWSTMKLAVSHPGIQILHGLGGPFTCRWPFP